MQSQPDKEINHKAALYDAAIELHKIRSSITPKKAKRIRKILLLKTTYDRKMTKLKKYQPELKETEKSFIKFTEFLNKSFRFKGYQNFIEETVAKSKIPPKIAKKIVKDSDLVTSFLNNKVKFKKDTPPEYWSEYYLPFPPHSSQKQYDIPEGIYKFWKKIDPTAEKIIEKIEIKRKREEESPSCTYNEKRGIFEIRCTLKTKTLPELFTFLHELGHAKQKAILKSKASKYQEEKYAYEFALKLAREIAPEDEFWAYLWFQAKDLIINGLFEYFLYTDETKEPSKLYAQLHNRFHQKETQKENYYYLTVPNLLFQNGDFFTSAVAFTQAVKKILLK